MAGPARTEAQRKEKAQDSRGQGGLYGHPDNAKGALRPLSGPQGKGKSRGEVKRSWTGGRPAATSDGKRRAEQGGEGGRAATRGSTAGAGLRGGAGGGGRAVHHVLSRFHWLYISVVAQPSSSPSSREKRAGRPSWVPVPRPPAAAVVGGGGGHARALEGWGGSVPSAGDWGLSSLLQPPCGSRVPEVLLDFEPALATWAGTGRAGSGRVQARGTRRPPRVRPAHPGGYVMWPEPRCGLRRASPPRALPRRRRHVLSFATCPVFSF